jgi:hypothetical protein
VLLRLAKRRLLAFDDHSKAEEKALGMSQPLL